MGFLNQQAPDELDNLQKIEHNGINLVSVKGSTPNLWGRAVARVLFSDKELEDYVLEPGRIDRNTRAEFPSPTRIGKLKSE